MENKTFYLEFNKDDFYQGAIIAGYQRDVELRVISKPKRKWYKLLFQYITFGLYKAPYTYLVKQI